MRNTIFFGLERIGDWRNHSFMPPVQLELKEVIQTMNFSLGCDMTNSRERMCDNVTACCGYICSKCVVKYQENR